VKATDDPTKNPETDTYSYIHLLVESLNSLGRLEMAVETVAQRLPLELFKVVEKCSNEVDQRYPAGFRARKGFSNALDFNDAGRAMILNDLFGTLYARFEAIAEGHRVVHEVISGITKREGTRGSSALTGGFRELWKLYQSEIRSLLHDYLSTNEDAFKMRENGAGTVFQKNSRDKTKVVSISNNEPGADIGRKCSNCKIWTANRPT
jgi:exocyst complex component 4